MLEAKFIYKCRLCGEIVVGQCTSVPLAETIMSIMLSGGEKAVEKFHQNRKIIGLPIKMLDGHRCPSGSYGIADLEGFVEETIL